MRILHDSTVALWLILSCLTSSLPAAVSVLSQSHRVWGFCNGNVSAQSYDVRFPETTTALPIGGHCQGRWDDGSTSSAESAAGLFWADAEAILNRSGVEYIYDAEAWAFSESRIVVRAHGDTPLLYDFVGSQPWERAGSFALWDLTEDRLVDEVLSYDPLFVDSIYFTTSHLLKAGHIYRLDLRLEAFADDTTDVGGGASYRIDVAVVPSPTSFALGLLGCISGAGLRRRPHVRWCRGCGTA